MVTNDLVLQEIYKNNRICPLPQKWNEMYQLLPKAKTENGLDEPHLPLILAAWWHTSPMEKRWRLEEHVQWAEDHGVLEKVYKYLINLDESDWYHLSE